MHRAFASHPTQDTTLETNDVFLIAIPLLALWSLGRWSYHRLAGRLRHQSAA